MLVLTDTFFGWPDVFPCRTNKAGGGGVYCMLVLIAF